MTPAAQAPAYLTARQTAELLHVSPQTLRAWIKGDKGFPRPVAVGRKLLFPQAELVRFLASLGHCPAPVEAK